MGTNQSLFRVDAPPATDDIGAVISWAHQQFQMIDIMLQSRELLPDYGGLQLRFQDGPAANQPLDGTPQVLTPYDQVAPPFDRSSGPEGIIPNVAGGTLRFDTQTEGIYLLGWWFTVQVEAGSEYSVEAYLNGNATGLRTIIDTSNQTATTTIQTTAMVAALDGDTIDLRGTAAGPVSPFDFIVEACQFFVAKIGGRLGGALLPTP